MAIKTKYKKIQFEKESAPGSISGNNHWRKPVEEPKESIMEFSKRWKISSFINGFGKLPAEYEKLKEVERMEFLQKNFGRIGIDVLNAQQSVQRMALPFGWLSRIWNFIINLMDWRA